MAVKDVVIGAILNFDYYMTGIQAAQLNISVPKLLKIGDEPSQGSQLEKAMLLLSFWFVFHSRLLILLVPVYLLCSACSK